MSENTSNYEGNNWQDDPLERTAPVRRNEGFLRARGYKSPDLTKVKFELVDKIRAAVERKGLTQHKAIEYLARNEWLAGISQPDFSKMLNANVKSFSVERLMLVLAALDNRVSLSCEPVEEGQGCVVFEHDQELEPAC